MKLFKPFKKYQQKKLSLKNDVRGRTIYVNTYFDLCFYIVALKNSILFIEIMVMGHFTRESSSPALPCIYYYIIIIKMLLLNILL